MSSLLQHHPSDEQLTVAVAAGDHAAFEELYRRYAHQLGAYGARVLRDRSRGEDVAQTALMRAYDALQRGTEPLRVKPWLYKIALNTALELKAKNGEVRDGESEDFEDTSHEMRSARADILGGVQSLPERQRKVFVLRELNGLPVGEVARQLELTNQQVEQALFAARNRLAEVLVFGDRLDCETVRAVDRSHLTHHERRAVKSHVRSCQSCRKETGLGLSTIGLWLRDAWAWLLGGGATAAKVGAVAMTATVVGSAPVVAPAVADEVFGRKPKAKRAAAVASVPGPALRELERLGRVFVPPTARAPKRLKVTAAPTQKVDADPLAELPIVNEDLAVTPEITEPAAEAAREEPAPPPAEARADEAPVGEPPRDPVLDEPTNSEPADVLLLNEMPVDEAPADRPPDEAPQAEEPGAMSAEPAAELDPARTNSAPTP
jgi:RNA polymerase sigma-70 factor (ECF subfamily)